MDGTLPEDIDELTVALGALQVTVRRRPGATDRAAARVEAADEDEFELVEETPAPDRTEQRKRELLAATTAEQFGAFDIPELRALGRRLRSPHPLWTPTARVVRAYRAGLAAGNKLAGQWGEGTPPSPELPFPARIYIALRAPRGGAPFWTTSGTRFFQRVSGHGGYGFGRGVVCQSLPSEAEAEAFLLGAGQPWPVQL